MPQYLKWAQYLRSDRSILIDRNEINLQDLQAPRTRKV